MSISFRHIALVFCISALSGVTLRAFGVIAFGDLAVVVVSHSFVGVVGLLIPSLIARFDARKKSNSGGMFG